MGDLSVNIAHSATSLIDGQAMAPIVDIPHMARLVQSMVRNSLDAFVSGDVDLARSVLASDDGVDRLHKACYHPVIAFMGSDPQNVRSSVVFLSVAGTLERLADHSTNIAENVLFYVQGVDVRHNSGHQPLDHGH
jgi:phosphate transport system protein